MNNWLYFSTQSGYTHWSKCTCCIKGPWKQSFITILHLLPQQPDCPTKVHLDRNYGWSTWCYVMSSKYRVIQCTLELWQMIYSDQSGLERRGKDLRDGPSRGILQLGLGRERGTAAQAEETKNKYRDMRPSGKWVTGRGFPAWEWLRSKDEPGQTVSPGAPRSGPSLYLIGAPEDL